MPKVLYIKNSNDNSKIVKFCREKEDLANLISLKARELRFSEFPNNQVKLANELAVLKARYGYQDSAALNMQMVSGIPSFNKENRVATSEMIGAAALALLVLYKYCRPIRYAMNSLKSFCLFRPQNYEVIPQQNFAKTNSMRH